MNQIYVVVGLRRGVPIRDWKDGQLSCSCEEPESFCSRNPKTCLTAAVVGVCILVATPWPDEILILAPLAIP